MKQVLLLHGNILAKHLHGLVYVLVLPYLSPFLPNLISVKLTLQSSRMVSKGEKTSLAHIKDRMGLEMLEGGVSHTCCPNVKSTAINRIS